MLKYLHRKAPVLALSPLLSATADKGVRALSLYSNYVPCIIHNNSSSYSQNYEDTTLLRARIRKYLHTRTQASLILFIPNHPLCRQVKSLELRIPPQHSQIKSAISPGWAPRRLLHYPRPHISLRNPQSTVRRMPVGRCLTAEAMGVS